MTFSDSHIHIYSAEYDIDLDNVIQQATRAGVKDLYIPAIDSSTHKAMLRVCDNYENCKPMIGLHPCSVLENYRSEIKIINELLPIRKFYAIGETGIDLYWEKRFFEQQKEALALQIELAIDHDLPIVLHTRESTAETIQVVKPYISKGLKGVFHCFSGTIDEAKHVADMGFYLGIGGVVTYKNAGMATVVKAMPLHSLVLETDGPYLSPVPYRGKRNQSSYIPIIAEKVAELKDVSVEEVARITYHNTRVLFNDLEAS